MRYKIKVSVFPLFALFIVLAAISGCAKIGAGAVERTAELEMVTDGDAELDISNQYELHTVSLGTVQRTAECMIKLAYTEMETLHSPYEGVLREYVVAEGDLVKKGDLIAILDFDTSAEKNRLTLMELQFAYDQKKAEETIAGQNEEYESFKENMKHETDAYEKKIKEYQLKKMDIDRTNQLASLNASLKRTEDEISELKEYINGYEVYAPIDGTVRNLSPQKAGNTIPWNFLVADVVNIEKRALTAETLVNNLRYGETYDIKTEDGELYSAKVVSQLPNIVKVRNNIYTFYLELADDEVDLDQLVQKNPKISLHVYKIDQVVVVPLKAIRTEDQANFVDIYADGVVKKRYVNIGLKGDGNMQIIDGVKPGQQVIVY